MIEPQVKDMLPALLVIAIVLAPLIVLGLLTRRRIPATSPEVSAKDDEWLKTYDHLVDLSSPPFRVSRGSMVDDSEGAAVRSQPSLPSEQLKYRTRHGIRSAMLLTISRAEHADWIIAKLIDRIRGKIVVEIGAGTGILSIAMASYAKHVYAIEAFPAWATEFAWQNEAIPTSYAPIPNAQWSARFEAYMTLRKPTNLTYIIDRAENLVGVINADVAVVVTGSDAENLRELAQQFAPDVCMPWQDWNGGIAVIRN